MSLVRLYSTYKMSEEGSEIKIKPFLESIVISCVYLFLVCYFSILVSGTFVSLTSPICFCFLGNLLTVPSGIFASLWNMSLQVITCVISYTTYRMNRSKIDNFDLSPHAGALSVLAPRYKVWINLQATRWLMPLPLLDSTVTFLSFLISNVCFFLLEIRSTEGKDLIGLGMTVILSVQSIIFPLISIRLQFDIIVQV